MHLHFKEAWTDSATLVSNQERALCSHVGYAEVKTLSAWTLVHCSGGSSTLGEHGSQSHESPIGRLDGCDPTVQLYH